MAKKELFAGHFEQAHAAAQQAIRTNPREFEAVLVMAAIAVEHGNVQGAAKLCDVVAGAGFESCWLVVIQGRLALAQQDQETARDLAVRACALGTNDPHVANQLGVLLSRTGRHAEAVEPLQIAVAGMPENADYRYNLAVALQFDGALAQAESQFRELVAVNPEHASGWLALVQLANTPEPNWFEALEAQFEAAQDPETRLLFGHALARLDEGRKNWDRSFFWLERAKEQKRLLVSHDRDASEKLADAALEAASVQRFAAEPDGHARPIFVVGMPRSGTTLVERILTSHSTVTSVGELSDFAIVLKRAMSTTGPLVLEPEVLRAAAAAPDLGDVGRDYLRRATPLAGNAERFIDKMPFNIFFVPAILRALPGARIVCLRRSPYDVLFANYRQLFATGFSYYSYNYDFGDTAHFVAQFERVAQAYEASLPSDRFVAIRYEDIISDQRAKTEQLLQFCGLEWEEACMEFHRNNEPVATASSVQVRQPLYSSSIGHWRRYGKAAQEAERELLRYGIAPS